MWDQAKGRMEMEFSIREAKQTDYKGLCEVFAEGDALHTENLPHVFREPEEPARTEEFVFSIIEDENAALFAAETGGQIIGLVQLRIREELDNPLMIPRRYTKIDDPIVRKGFRRFRVGQSLVQKAHLWALDKGAIEVELNVWEFNKGAIAFYEKIGYRTISLKMAKSLR